MESGIQLMFDLSPLTTYPEQTVGASAHLVRTSPSQDSEKDLGGTEVPSFEKYFGYLGSSKKKIDLNGLSTKMLRECYQATEDLTSLPFSLNWTNWGYDAEWEIFNTKNFGVPQNRERVYVVGHSRSRGRKQIFPLKGADREDSVCKVMQIGQRNRPGRDNLNQFRVYDDKGISPCLNKMDGGGREPHIPVAFGIDFNVGGSERGISNALTARYNKGCANYAQTGTAVAIPVLTPDRAEKRQNGRRFKDNGDESFTLTAQDRHGVALKVKEATKQGYAIAHEGDSINLSMPESKTRRGRVGNQVAQTLDCGCNQGIFVKLNESTTVYAVWYEKYNCYIAIRKLTPRECFRLQGWTDDYFEKAAFVNSDSQLYKQAGNAITVDIAEEIGRAFNEIEIQKSDD